MMENVSVTTAAIAQVPVVFLAVTPGIEKVLKVDNETDAAVVRHTYTVAAGISIFIGTCLAIVARDATPLLFTLATVAVMVLVLEHLTTMQDSTIQKGN